ncbi:MAG: HEAT repeat domain-containing protein [Planctomycetes bacterium]|nr:HEAT repeat domain-containing protein [Planctomycetota bacterium]
MFKRLFLLMVILVVPSLSFAQSGAKTVDPDPELERKTFILPEGFEVNLYAADPLLAKPIQMNFDPQGRLWVACSEVYPHIQPGQKANDKILILEDTKGVGKADKVTVFADGLLIPTGVEPGDGGAYVANSTELLHLTASKPGGKADKTRVVLSGFGTEDTHHILHTLRWGPEGMLYFNQSIYIHSHIETPHGVKRLNGGGIWRFRPETMHLDVFVRGFINSWGHHIDRYGQSFITDGANGEGITHGIPGAGYPTVVGMPRILHGLNPGSPKHCGLEILSGTHLPEEYRGNMLTNDFRGHRVCRFVLKDDGSTYASQEKAELIKSNHPAFRPIDIKMGPDGAIYIADWYNPIIQHGEIDFRDPRRDHTHGRIWRVTAKGRPLVKKPEFDVNNVESLLNHLTSPEDWTRQQARRLLKECGAKAVLPVLDGWVKKLDPAKSEYEPLLLEALWTYQALNEVKPELLATALRASKPEIRAAATRMLADWYESIPSALELATERVRDDHPRVRLEAVRTLARFRTARAAEVAMTALDKPVDRVIDYALWLTAKDLESAWMASFKEGKLDFNGNARHLSFALESVGSAAATGPILKLIESKKLAPDREHALWMLLAKIGGHEELALVLQQVDFKFKTPEQRGLLLAAVEDAVRQRKILPPRNVKDLFKTLSPDDVPLVRLMGLWKIERHRASLQQFAGNAKLPIESRVAAFEALAVLGGPESRELFDVLSESKEESTSRLAIAALATLNLDAGAKRAIDFLKGAQPNDDNLGLFMAFLNRKGGAASLTKALAGNKLPPDIAKLGLRALRSSVQDAPALVEALNKAGDLAAQKRELTKPELDLLVAEVAKSGDAARGEALYRRADLQCMKCHAIGGSGGQVGPDLVSIGASAPVDYLIESLLVPAKAVKEGYHALRIETADGKVHSGIKIRETKTEMVLRTVEDREITITVKDIEDKRETRSLMPDGLVDTLTRAELVDMVKFMSELGKLGPFSLGKGRVVRRWQVLQPTPAALNAIRRSRVAAAAENDPAFEWQSAYGKVSGEFPLDAAPSLTIWKDTAPLAVIRCQLDVTVGGKVKLKLNSAAGVSMLIGTNPLDAKDEMTIDVPFGVQTLMFAIDLSKRKEPLRVELEDVPDSKARAVVVGGK